MQKAKDIFFSGTAPVVLARSIDSYIQQAHIPLIFPFYHAVSDTPMPHIDALYHVRNTQTFEEDVDFLLEHFYPLHPEDMFSPAAIPKGKTAFLLSFDDGLREIRDHIAPVLKRKGVPAIFFINPDFIDNRSLFYRYRESCIIHILKNRDAKAEPIQLPGKTFPDIQKAENYILSLGYSDTQILDGIETELGIDDHQFLAEYQPYLGLQDLKALSSDGFYIGAHSMDHPEYALLSEEQQLRQTRESLAFIARHFAQKYNFFAFPFSDDGVKESFFRKMQEPGSVMMHASFGTAGMKTSAFPGHYQRVPMEKKDMKAGDVLKMEFAYFLTKRFFGIR